MAESPDEFQLKSPPEGDITAVKFGPQSCQFLLVSSDDTKVRLYDIIANELCMEYSHSDVVVDCAFYDSVHCYSGGLDNTVKAFDFNAAAESVVGTHEDCIECVEFCPDVNVIVTGSTDSTVKLWDPRSPCCTGSLSQPDEVFTLAVCGDRLVVGTDWHHVMVWDLRNMGSLQQHRRSSLKGGTTCIRCFPNRQGYVLSDLRGLVAVEYLDLRPEVQMKKYAFKDGRKYLQSVNAIAFHNQYNTFATGDSEGYVNIWDGFNKKRLCQLPRYPGSISSLAFSHDGSALAIASSVRYGRNKFGGIIFIRNVSDQETKPKS